MAGRWHSSVHDLRPIMNPIGDYWLTGYSVDAKLGEIRLRAEWPHAEIPEGMPRNSEICFREVEAYHLVHDNFGTILGWIVERPVAEFVSRLASEFEAGFSHDGWPHFWRGSVEQAVAYLQSQGARAFEIVSTLGLTGWVLARDTDAPVTDGTSGNPHAAH